MIPVPRRKSYFDLRSLSLRSRHVVADTDVAEADEATGRRIARRIWGPMKKQVSDTIGAPAAVASTVVFKGVQLIPFPRYPYPFRLAPYIYDTHPLIHTSRTLVWDSRCD